MEESGWKHNLFKELHVGCLHRALWVVMGHECGRPCDGHIEFDEFKVGKWHHYIRILLIFCKLGG